MHEIYINWQNIYDVSCSFGAFEPGPPFPTVKTVNKTVAHNRWLMVTCISDPSLPFQLREAARREENMFEVSAEEGGE